MAQVDESTLKTKVDIPKVGFDSLRSFVSTIMIINNGVISPETHFI